MGNTMLDIIGQVLADRTGATAIEYSLIATLVSAAAVGALMTLGESLNTFFFSSVGAKLASASAAAITP
jgi:pilus assembly protein Flp/PilA